MRVWMGKVWLLEGDARFRKESVVIIYGKVGKGGA